MASTKATELAQLSRKLTYNEGTDVANIDGDGSILTTGDNTDQLQEGSTNLYYLDSRVRSALSAGTGITYNSTTGEIAAVQDISTTSNPTFADVTVDSLILTGGTDANAGTLSWNVDEGTLDVALENGVVLQTGQEQHFYGKASEAISNGDVVMFAGAQGNHLLIAKADEQSVGFAPEFVIGIATQDFANNEFGYVTSFGKVRALDTSAYAEGTVLYLDPTTAGGLTSTKPTPPNHVIEIAAVTRAHAAEGTVLVRLIHMVDTDEVTEGSTNLYYTDARVETKIDSYVTGGTGVDVTSGAVSIGQAVATTDNVTFHDITATGNVQIDGDLTVSGTTVTINATNLAVEDNMIYLNDGSAVTNPDLGFAGNYNDGTYAHAGLFRDASDGVWKFYDGYTPEPDATAFIDTGHASFNLSSIQADTFIGNVTGNVTGTVSDVSNHDTDDISEGSTNLYYTDGRVQAAVTQSYINSLNVDADTVDGKHYDDIISEATALAIALG